MTLFDRVAVFGAGLLGGSIGLACREKEIAGQVYGIGRSRSALDEAVRVGAIDHGYTDMKQGIEGADLVVLCTPVQHIVSILPSVVQAAKPGAIITDVGSTKLNIVRTGEEASAGTGKNFVGSHPMAGSEQSGVRNARPDLYDGSTCFVTKTAQTDLDSFTRVCAFWRALKGRIVVMRPERHDRLVALVSHLPHLVAVALLRAVENSNEDKNLIKGIIGNGFRDTTRIAAGSVDMWDDICTDNTNEIRKTRDEFTDVFNTLIEECDPCGPELREILEAAADYRRFIQPRQ